MPGYARPTTTSTSNEVVITPVGNISSTLLQGAIQELDSEKEKLIPLQSSAPTSPVISDLWVDNTNPLKPVLKVYNGTSWIIVDSLIEVDDDQLILATRMFA